ncbi:MAG: c-type cytochrome [Betaproteobacteria bacterium]
MHFTKMAFQQLELPLRRSASARRCIQGSTGMKRVWLLAAVAGQLLAVLAQPVLAQTGAPAKPDTAKAQQIVAQVCVACHGAEGVSVASANPHLAGQHAEYTARQLDHFKSGLRKNPVMMAMAASLSADDMRALGVYFADKKSRPGAAKDKALAEVGQRVYRGGNAKTGVPACASCHSPTGLGIPAQYPRLAGQFPEYIYAQLQGFVRGDRGGEMKNASGKLVEDAPGRIMAAIAGKMNDREMRAVAEYLAGLR